jgi:signal transduction histidine kinase
MGLSIAACLLVGYIILLWLLWWLWAHRAALQRPRWAALSVSMLAMVVAGGHDMLMLYRVGVPSTDPYALFWGFTVLLLVCVTLSSSYLLRSLRQAEGFNDQLEHTIRSKTAQLESTYAQLREGEREGARAQAREHLLREMHDGIGAQLVTALRGIERGALAPQQVVQFLQDSLDELRMLMDSTDLNAYLPAALAAWRNRWDAKLAAAGVALNWHIDDSLDTLTLSSDATLQVMRILQEAAANVVKHSQAQKMTLSARMKSTDGQKILQIDITDDGIGLPSEAVRVGARGLKNMHHRASEMGAQLTVSSARVPLSGCRVLLEMPMQ